MENNNEEKIPFTGHLEELRKRLIICIIAVIVGFIACYGFKIQILDFLIKPLLIIMPDGQAMIFTGLTDKFFVYIKVSFLAGTILALPVIMHQVWRFVSPGLYPKEKHAVFPMVIFSCLFFLLGVGFGFFLVLPYGFEFLLHFGSPDIQAMPAIDKYLSLITKMLLAFGLVFQLPIFITVFARFGIVSVDFLTKNRKYALLIFLIGGAILTPPDPLTQIMMALPMVILYEVSILSARIFGKKAKKDDEDDGEEDGEE